MDQLAATISHLSFSWLQSLDRRMQQERENIEACAQRSQFVRLREMRARMAEERKTRLEQIQAIFAGLGAGVQSVLEDRSKMTVLVGGLTALALGVSVAYRARLVSVSLQCQHSWYAIRTGRPGGIDVADELSEVRQRRSDISSSSQGLNLAMRLSQMPWRTKPEALAFHGRAHVKLIDPKDRYVFLPLLIDYATGIVELDEFAPTFQDLLEEAPGVQHIQSLASEVDWRRRKERTWSPKLPSVVCRQRSFLHLMEPGKAELRCSCYCIREPGCPGSSHSAWAV
ncbi:unnamed protein product [Cladocopium goreaui]|uniref:ATPase family AAA domain-containing protein n=1 Tax=Cladocopium goreaui TaxID=2562237 RepID=A0A9P1BKD9_9DINO|nr:unnamed protein product [Cladocopium goreaui]